jgi:hypothetical protein
MAWTTLGAMEAPTGQFLRTRSTAEPTGPVPTRTSDTESTSPGIISCLSRATPRAPSGRSSATGRSAVSWWYKPVCPSRSPSPAHPQTQAPGHERILCLASVRRSRNDPSIGGSIPRHFPLRRLFLQFRVEFFNALNHPQFGLPSSTIGVGGVGTITSTQRANRQMQLALRLSF